MTADPKSVVESVAESVFRQESGRNIATLIRISGSFDRTDEAMHQPVILLGKSAGFESIAKCSVQFGDLVGDSKI